MTKYVTLLILFNAFLHANAQSGSLAENAWKNLTEARFSSAKGLAAEAIEKDNSDALAYAVHGYTLIIEGNNRDAEKDLEKAVALKPAQSPYLALLAWCYFMKGEDKSEVDKICRKAEQSEKPLKDCNLVELFGKLLRRAVSNPSSGGGDYGLDEATNLIQKSPKFVHAYAIRANIYKLRKKYDKAIADYSKALEINAAFAIARLGRGDVYQEISKYDLALKDYQKLLEAAPSNAIVHNRIGNVQMDMYEYEKAIESYSKAIGLNANYINAYRNRAIAFESVAQTDWADKDWKKYQALGGTDISREAFQPRIYPQGKFDAALAGKMLKKGTASISGRACTSRDGYQWNANGMYITLYPATPYVEEWFELQKKKGRKTAVYMANAAYQYSITVNANQNGEYRFDEISPGRYLLIGDFALEITNTKDVYDGAQREGPAMVHYYHKEKYVNNYNDKLFRFVEVKANGEALKKVSLTRTGRGGCYGW
ncbi:tetratricopeptide repeat protein [Pseudoflavitalea sp. G-6-1-2]|uniref:tetratricopeptide repeat protein n=1 Tax=Pseudoflavitalea sp. G-6-1-2 TaxID=2728841 RepID=UPI00146AC88D|nr:tetratricopeptide repeat protein [Pseudoflavitalea sp. G-6-1-2]NML23101.1 tetratricopeptide repeat protein [Pseudoflavitalea sp. G-6-1-2]